MSIYPSAIDGFEQIPLVVDGVTRVNAVSVNTLREAIINIETELGIVPSDSFDTVADRLDDFEERISELETIMDSIVVGGGVTPTGTGFTHITGGVQDLAAKLVENADVASSAAIVESKLALNFATHSNTNDPTSSEKAALTGTSGTPSISNPYVTNDDPRLDEFTTSQDGLVPSPGSVSGLFLQDDGTWASPGGSGDVVGPGSSTDNAVARFHLTTGKIIQNSTVIIGDTGNVTGLGTLNTHTIPGGTGTIALTSDLSSLVTGPGSATDNAVARFDLTTGKIIQNSVVTIADTTGNVAGVGTLNTHTIPGGTGTLALTSDIPAAYTDELAQDAVGTILTDTTTIDFIYTDVTPTITADVRTNSISNSLLSQVNTQTFKGRTTASTGNVEDLTATQATAILNNFVGDSGSGGTKGLVPAPAAGDAAADRFLKADGTWDVPTAGPGGDGSRTTFTYQPGGVDDPNDGLYIDFNDLYTEALAASVANNLVTIIIDDRFTSPAVIPDGTFDLRNITLIGVCAFINETFFLTAMETGNTVFENWFTGINFISLTHTGPDALMLVPFDDPANCIRTGFRSIYSAEAAPIWSHVDDGYMGERDVVLIADAFTEFSGLGGYEIFEVQSPNQIFVRCGGEFILGASTVRGDGNFNISRSAINGDFDTSQPNLGGELVITDFDPRYTPSDEGNWDNVPTLMSEALDELALVVAGLGAGSGDVVGPGSATDNALVRFDSTTGKLIKNSTVIADNSGNITGLGTLNTHTIPGGTGTLALTSNLTNLVTGPGSATDNAVARFDLTTGKIIQNSVVTIADTTGNMAGVGTLNTHTIPGGTGTLALTSDITITTGKVVALIAGAALP